LDRIQRQFFWWTWRGDAAKYCRNCQECCSTRRQELLESAKPEPIEAALCRDTVNLSPLLISKPDNVSDNAHDDCSESDVTEVREDYNWSPYTYQQSVEPVYADDDSGCSEPESDDCTFDMSLAIAKYKRM